MDSAKTGIEHTDNGDGRRGRRWRIAAWSGVALILLAPLAAMQLTAEVDWKVVDFIFAGILLVGTGLLFELTATKTGSGVHRAAVGVALAAALILIWVNGAVGIIGSEDNDLNLMYGGVIAVGVIGALLARFEPRGMARAMAATAIAQVLAAVVALIAGYFTLMLNGFFVALWLIAARLFQNVARAGTERSAV